MSKRWGKKLDIISEEDFPHLNPSTSRVEPTSKVTLEERVFFLEQQVQELLLEVQAQKLHIKDIEEKAVAERLRVARKEKAERK